MDNHGKSQKIIDKYLAKTASEHEQHLVERFYLEQFESSEIPEQINFTEGIKAESWHRIKKSIGIGNNPKSSNVFWNPIFKVAAVFLLISTAVIFFYRYATQESDLNVGKTLVIAKDDIQAGGNAAILKLADGSAIKLSSAKTGVVINDHNLAYNDGSTIDISASSKAGLRNSERGNVMAHEQLSAETPKGGTYQLVLSDGTKVWLNASSNLTFPSTFKSLKDRRVFLRGEAYFEVTKANRPFIVSTDKQNVQVLGTHFNINSYPDEPDTKTTLLEGSVRISLKKQAHASRSDNETTEVTLKPRQQAHLNQETILVQNVNPDSSVDWKNGDFVLKGVSFKTTMRKIARWYDVDVVYDANVPEHIELGGWISRKSSLSVLLKRMELAGNVHFKIEGRRITVTR